MSLSLFSAALGLIFVATSIGQIDPTFYHYGPGGDPLPPNPDMCWSEPPDLQGYLVSSEVIGEFGLETETANDFVLDGDGTITVVRWWGGYWTCADSCDPGMSAPGFYLRFYEDDDCLPTVYGAYAEFFVEGSAGETYIGCQEGLRPLYRYEAEVNVPIIGGVRCWLSAQMASHGYPPQWGRLAAGEVTGCESAFRGGLLVPWWYPISDVFGVALDLSQEFECETPVAVEECSWGRTKGLYR